MKFPYQKILVLGCGGAGKSMFAREMGERFALPVVHLDKLWWLPNWVKRDRDEFDKLLLQELNKPAWIMDGNFKRTINLRLNRCDVAVFLDIPAEECLQNVYARAEEYRGKSRPDMAEGCEERVDEEFKEWVMHYDANVRGGMLVALSKSRKPYFVFKSRKEAYAWLNEFTK